MKRILFVDDEPYVLQGLKRMLHPMRHEWAMEFAGSGEEALDTFARQPFDVIVSDMRMPGIDGATLLSEVMRQYPQTVRIVLSGHSSNETAFKMVGTAHQYLAKPCDAETLKRTVERAFVLRELLQSESLKKVLASVKSLPAVPAVYHELVEELRFPDASVKRIGEIISQDPGMTAKVLQLVNSAFFGLPRDVSSPAQAAGLLGMDTIKALVLSIGVFSQFEGGADRPLELDALWRHCSQTAVLAKQIAKIESQAPHDVDAAFMAALLHDIGKLVLAQNLPLEYGDVMSLMVQQSLTLCEAEHHVFQATHAEVGAYLLGLWGLPDPIVEAAAFHHHPSANIGRTFCPLTATHVANVFTHEHDDGENGKAVAALDRDYLDRLGLIDRIPTWQKVCRDALDHGGVT